MESKTDGQKTGSEHSDEDPLGKLVDYRSGYQTSIPDSGERREDVLRRPREGASGGEEDRMRGLPEER